MYLARRIFLLVLCVGILFAGVCRAEVSVSAQVDTSRRIYSGDRFTYYIIVEGTTARGIADVSVMRGYNPQSGGIQDMSSRSIRIVNNKTYEEVVQKYVMTYQMTAGEAGVYELPAVNVEIEGRSYTTNPVKLYVAKAGESDKMEVEISLSDQRCYVGQPVVFTFKWYLSGKAKNGSINIPVFFSDDFYVEDTLSQQQSDPRELSAISGVPVKLNQRQVVRKGVNATEVYFSKILIPKRAGVFKIEPASVSADIVVGAVSRRREDFFGGFDSFFGPQEKYERFGAKSDGFELEVLPLPTDGRPDDFYGLVGRYEISTDATPVQVSVGDPITLNIRVKGEYLKPVQWPALEDIAGMGGNFRIPNEKASPTIERGYKVFTQTIRATNADVGEIPAVPLSFFDVDRGEYVTVASEPIKLDVAATNIITLPDIETSGLSSMSRQLEAAKKGISANFEDMDVLLDESFSLTGAIVSLPYAVVWGGSLGILIISAVGRGVLYSSPKREANRRRKNARSRAIKGIKGCSSKSAAEKSQEMSLVMKQYVAERFDRVAGSLTSADCYEVIRQSTGDGQIADKFRSILDGLEAAVYSSQEAAMDENTSGEIIDLIRMIEKKSK